MLETLRWVDHTDKDAQGIFPPSILRLTFPSFYGVHVLYDVHDRGLFLSLRFILISPRSS
jgi:hypothetical protein